jgi:hypothetical protein
LGVHVRWYLSRHCANWGTPGPIGLPNLVPPGLNRY